MGVEIERKFLVDPVKWAALDKPTPLSIQQVYLSKDISKTIRVRMIGDRAFLTIKGKNKGISRLEFEYEIPKSDADALMELCEDVPLIKDRYVIVLGEDTWEVDVFYGANEGLLMAEIELDSESTSFQIPDWIGAEVSDDPRYYNVNLMQNPFSSW